MRSVKPRQCIADRDRWPYCDDMAAGWTGTALHPTGEMNAASRSEIRWLQLWPQAAWQTESDSHIPVVLAPIDAFSGGHCWTAVCMQTLLQWEPLKAQIPLQYSVISTRPRHNWHHEQLRKKHDNILHIICSCKWICKGNLYFVKLNSPCLSWWYNRFSFASQKQPLFYG